MRLVVVFACAVSVPGCGFQRALGSDGGAADDLAGADLGGADLSGLDLAGADLSTPGSDLSGLGGTGPGPLGALPAGFCCSNNEECRSRRCRPLVGGGSFCSDDCDHDGICTVWGGSFKCDTSGSGQCVAVSGATACVDAQTYTYGLKKTGACCSAGFDKAGQECEGGLCNSTGPQSNPFFCTQGCDGNTPCSPPYVCNAIGFCSLPDPQATYTCQ